MKNINDKIEKEHILIRVIDYIEKGIELIRYPFEIFAEEIYYLGVESWDKDPTKQSPTKKNEYLLDENQQIKEERKNKNSYFKN